MSNSPEVVTITEAKANWSRLVRRAESGEEIIITRAGKPCARLVPLLQVSRRAIAGMDAGRIWIADDFNETPKDIIDSFYDSRIDGGQE
jgi:prevent-host-death family protein